MNNGRIITYEFTRCIYVKNMDPKQHIDKIPIEYRNNDQRIYKL